MPADAVAALMLARRPGMLLTTGERARRARPGGHVQASALSVAFASWAAVNGFCSHDTSAGRPRLARSPT